MIDDPDKLYAFTPKGLQHLMDRALLRRSMAEQEGDTEEATMAFAEVLAFTQLVDVYGWTLRDVKILEVENDR